MARWRQGLIDGHYRHRQCRVRTFLRGTSLQCVFSEMCFVNLVKVFYVAFQVANRRALPATSPRKPYFKSGAQGTEVQEPFVDVMSSLVAFIWDIQHLLGIIS